MLRCNNGLTWELNRYGRTYDDNASVNILLNASVKGTNTHTWECISTVTWVYTNPHMQELNRYRPDQTGPDRTGPDDDDDTL